MVSGEMRIRVRDILLSYVIGDLTRFTEEERTNLSKWIRVDVTDDDFDERYLPSVEFLVNEIVDAVAEVLVNEIVDTVAEDY